MSFESPAKRRTEQDTSAAPVVAEESRPAFPEDACEHATAAAAPHAGLGALTETASTAETLEHTARLLGDIDVAVTSLRLDRGGFVTLWKSLQTPARSG